MGNRPGYSIPVLIGANGSPIGPDRPSQLATFAFFRSIDAL